MKTKYWLYILIVGLCGVFAQCKKNKTEVSEDPSNHSLRQKSIEQIRAEVKGNWEIKRIWGCGGFAGICGSANVSNDFVSFLPNDTVKRVKNGMTTIYERANVMKRYSSDYKDSVYMFEMSGGFYLWTMHEIKNDSLIITEGFINNYSLIRKP
jgi:hypothetical protein